VFSKSLSNYIDKNRKAPTHAHFQLALLANIALKQCHMVKTDHDLLQSIKHCSASKSRMQNTHATTFMTGVQVHLGNQLMVYLRPPRQSSETAVAALFTGLMLFVCSTASVETLTNQNIRQQK